MELRIFKTRRKYSKRVEFSRVKSWSRLRIGRHIWEWREYTAEETKPTVEVERGVKPAFDFNPPLYMTLSEKDCNTATETIAIGGCTQDDCQRGKDSCCDCHEGDLYKSPDMIGGD